jgi:hypothetical protein
MVVFLAIVVRFDGALMVLELFPLFDGLFDPLPGLFQLGQQFKVLIQVRRVVELMEHLNEVLHEVSDFLYVLDYLKLQLRDPFFIFLNVVVDRLKLRGKVRLGVAQRLQDRVRV